MTKICPKCEMEYADDENYCEECGVKLINLFKDYNYEENYTKICPKCEKRYKKNDIYCENCGINLKNFNTYLTEKEEKLKTKPTPQHEKINSNENSLKNNINKKENIPSKVNLENKPSSFTSRFKSPFKEKSEDEEIEEEILKIREMKIDILKFKKDWETLKSTYIQSPKDTQFKNDHQKLFKTIKKFKHLKEIQNNHIELENPVKDLLEIQRISENYIKEIRLNNENQITKEIGQIELLNLKVEEMNRVWKSLHKTSFTLKDAVNFQNKYQTLNKEFSELKCLNIIESRNPELKNSIRKIKNVNEKFNKFSQDLNQINKEKNEILNLNQPIKKFLKDWSQLKTAYISKNESEKFKNQYQNLINQINQLKHVNLIKIYAPELKNEINQLTDVQNIFKDYQYLINLNNRGFKMNNNDGDKTENKSIEIIETKLTCPQCGEGNVILIISHKNGKEYKFFRCSEDDCDWNGGFYNQDIDKIDQIENCPSCDGIMYVKNGKKGPFMSCSKFPECRESHDIAGTKSNDEYDLILTELKCPKCKEGTVTVKINKKDHTKTFQCSEHNCDWDGGYCKQDELKIDNLEYCPSCDGIMYQRNSKNGPFMSCSKFPKCRESHDIIEKNNTNHNHEKVFERIPTELTCPKCEKGKVTLIISHKPGKESKFFRCSEDECDWNGGFYKGENNKVDNLEYCPSCDGIMYQRNGKRGPFMTCSNFPKCRESHDVIK